MAHGTVTVVSESLVDAPHHGALAGHVWTVNDVAETIRPFDFGVDGLVSDRPTTLVELLNGRGRAGSGALAEDYPRPQFGFLPWLAFFLARSLRFTVRFDIGDNVSG